MGQNTSPESTVSPKVAASGLGGAIAVVLAWALGQIPFLADAPTVVQGALVTLFVAAVTFAAGYIKRDPLR